MYMHVIYLQLDSSSSAGRFQAFLVFQARRAASDLDFLRIHSVLATERPPTRGWGLPKFHSQALISETWLLYQNLSDFIAGIIKQWKFEQRRVSSGGPDFAVYISNLKNKNK
jgi:hypothetical protein